MKKLLLLLICPVLALGQATTGYHRVNQVLARAGSGVTAQIVPNATVYVTVTATGLPATIYTDPLLTSQIISASVTSDSNGNYGYYITTNYCVNETISAPQMGSVNVVNICGNSGSISLPVSVANGGTGASTAAQALTNLGGLAKANNLSDVSNAATALSNLGGVSINNSSLQSLTGPIAITGTFPFGVSLSAAVGFGANGTDDADWYSLTYNSGAAHVWWGVNSGNTAFQKLMTLDNGGNLSPQGDVSLTAGNCLYLGGTSVEGVCDDNAGGVSISTTSSATNGISLYRNSTRQWLFDASGNLNNSLGVVIPSGATGSTGTGNMVLSIGGTTSNLIVGTQPNSDNSTKAASTAYVNNLITSISSGVTSINGTGGAFTFSGSGVSCTTTTCTFSSTGIANVVFSPFGSATSVPGNSCTSPSSFTMTGVVTTPTQSAVWPTWQGNPHLTNGWGTIGGLQLDMWVSGANTVSWTVCNPTSSSILSGTPAFIIAAQ